MMLIKNGSPPPKDRNNPKLGYLAMQQQFELMNTRFIKIISEMTGLTIKMTNFLDGLDRRGWKEEGL